MMRSLRRLVASAVWGLHRRIVLGAAVDDPWARVDYQPSLRLYGSGITANFADYLEGASAVPVATIDDITQWLDGMCPGSHWLAPIHPFCATVRYVWLDCCTPHLAKRAERPIP